MNKEGIGAVVATLTLELGIDIGDIDCVVFFGPPATCFSLLQRLGRGNRRKNFVFAYGIYRDLWERIVFECMFELIKFGYIEEEAYNPRISVAAQQIVSYVLQRRRIGTSKGSLKTILKPLNLDDQSISNIVDSLVDKDYLKYGHYDLLYPADKLDRFSIRGTIHSNIEKSLDTYEVIDKASSLTVGKVEKLCSTFVLEGKMWNLDEVRGNKIFVRQAPHFLSEKRVFARIFKGRGRPLWDWRFGLRLKTFIFPEARREEFVYRIEEDCIIIYHFLGMVYGYLWANSLARKGFEVTDIEGIYLVGKGMQLKDFFEVSIEDIEKSLYKSYRSISRFLNLGYWFHILPENLKRLAVRHAINPEGLHSLICGFTPKPIIKRDQPPIF
jgi:hypothetical protein